MDTPDVPAIMQKVGEVTVGWNEVELVWCQIFGLLLHELPRDKTAALFRTCLTGAAQRYLVMAVAGPSFENHPELWKELSQLRTRTDEVSGLRNEVVHGNYFAQAGNASADETVMIQYKHQRLRSRLANKTIMIELEKILEKIGALETDLVMLGNRLRRPETGFVPDYLTTTPLSEIFSTSGGS